MAVQGGYFFIFLMTSLKATKTIASTNKYVISAIGIYTSFPEVSKQPPPFPYRVILTNILFVFKTEVCVL